jgi:hypothetical protein
MLSKNWQQKADGSAVNWDQVWCHVHNLYLPALRIACILSMFSSAVLGGQW